MELARNRTCGECTACCKTHFVGSISKQAGVWCVHCTPGKGCKIYESRPGECQRFVCQWIKGYGTEEDRPDKRKIVVDSNIIDGVGRVASLWEVSEGSLENSFSDRVIKELLDISSAVLCVHLSGQIVAHVKNEELTLLLWEMLSDMRARIISHNL